MSKKPNAKAMICIMLTILIIGILTGCSSNMDRVRKDTEGTQKSGFASISPEKAKERMEHEEGIILLDVRTEEEYDEGHIEGSILIPLDTLKDKVSDIIKDKDVPVFVYCRSGNRSNTAAGILADLGYADVYDLGGIIDWPYEVVK